MVISPGQSRKQMVGWFDDEKKVHGRTFTEFDNFSQSSSPEVAQDDTTLYSTPAAYEACL